MIRIKENLRQCEEMNRILTVKNESLTCNNNLLNQRIKELKRTATFQEELKSKVKYYKDKYYCASKTIEAMRKEVRKTGDLGRETFAQREVDTSLICSVCEENRLMGGSIKEKFESMHDQFKIIRKFSNRGGSKYIRRRVENIYICIYREICM